MVQAVILFRSETWVMTPHTSQALGGFHHIVDRQITGRQPRRIQGVSWEYLYLEEAMWEARLEEVEAYV